MFTAKEREILEQASVLLQDTSKQAKKEVEMCYKYGTFCDCDAEPIISAAAMSIRELLRYDVDNSYDENYFAAACEMCNIED